MRILKFLFHRFSLNGISLLVIAVITFLITDSLESAAWIPENAAWTAAAWLSFLIGTLLAAGSRLSGKVAIGYEFLLGFLTLGLSIGKIIPPLNSETLQNPAAALDIANIRIFSYLDRLWGWLAALWSGAAIQDNGLFQLVIGLAIWGCVSWLSWMVFRRRNAVAGLIPGGLLLSINTYLSGQSVERLLLFLGFSLVLITRLTILKETRRWDEQQIDYPDELNWGWWGSAITIGLVILLAARISPWLGTPQGWKALNEIFQEANQRLEDTTSRLFGDVAPPPARSEYFAATSEPPAERALPPEMGVVGPAPLQSSAIVMWVKTSDPPPQEAEPGMPEPTTPLGPIHYWRSSLFGAYTGTGWEELSAKVDRPSGSIPLPAVELPLPPTGIPIEPRVPGRYPLYQEFEFVAQHEQSLFAAAVPAAVSDPGRTAALKFAGAEGSPLVFGAANTVRYSVFSWATAVTDIQLRSADADYPSTISANYLALPAALPQRVRDLARRIVGDSTNPYDKTVRIQDYLRLSYPYDLQVPLPPAGRDVVDYFLFDAPGGFCAYYASAMVVMLRSQGIPARVASGYATGSYDFSRGAYRVTPSNAHAWAEVFFPGYGWVEFEPTAGLQRIQYDTAAGAPQISQNLPARPIQPANSWQTLAFAIGMLALPLFLFGLFFWLRARQQSYAPHMAQNKAERIYQNLRQWLAWAGLRGSPSATPAEYLHAHLETLQPYAPLLTALEKATALYEQAVFSTHPIHYSQLAELHNLTQRLWMAWLGLFLQQFKPQNKK